MSNNNQQETDEIWTTQQPLEARVDPYEKEKVSDDSAPAQSPPSQRRRGSTELADESRLETDSADVMSPTTTTASPFGTPMLRGAGAGGTHPVRGGGAGGTTPRHQVGNNAPPPAAGRGRGNRQGPNRNGRVGNNQQPKPKPKPGPPAAPQAQAGQGPQPPRQPRGGRGRGRGQGPPGGNPPPNPGPQQQPAGPPAQVPPRTFEGNFQYFKVRIGDTYKGAIKRLSALGIPHEPVTASDSVHAHPAAAAVRTYMTAHALTALYHKGCRTILSLYGSERDLKLVSILNKGVQDPMRLTVYRPLLTPGDTHRRVQHQQILGASALQQTYDGYFLCDVYALGNETFTPDTLFMITGNKPVVWIGHHFNGAAGTIEGEGGWIRAYSEGIDYVKIKSDVGDTSRPLQDPLDWMHLPGIKAVGPAGTVWALWDRAFAIGDSCEIHFDWSTTQPPPVRVPPPVPSYEWVTLPIPESFGETVDQAILYASGFLPVLIYALPRRQELIDLALKRDLIEAFSGRSYTAYAWRSISGTAQQRLSNDPKYLLLQTLFPEAKPIVEATALAAFLDGVSHKAGGLEWMNRTHGSAMQRYNAAVTEVGNAPTLMPTWTRLVTYAVALAAAVYLAKRGWQMASARGSMADLTKTGRGLGDMWTGLKTKACAAYSSAKEVILHRFLPYCASFLSEQTGSIAPSTFVWMVLTSTFGDVVVEEVIKSTRVGAKWFPILEVFLKLVVHPVNAPNVVGTFLAFCMHTMIQPYTFWKRVGLHTTWNFVMLLACNGARGRAGIGSYLALMSIATLNIWCKSNGRSEWSLFKENYYALPWEQRGPPPNTSRRHISSFDAMEGIVPCEPLTFVKEQKAQDLEVKVRGSLWTFLEEEPTTNVYWILPTSVPGYSPAHTDANLYALIENRLALQPELPPADQLKAWLPHLKFCLELVNPHPAIVFDETLADAYIKTIDDGRKRGIAIAAWKHLKLHGVRLQDREINGADVFLKTDELLLQSDDDSVRMKGRPIVRVHPHLQMRVAPEIQVVSARLHADWAWEWESDKWFDCGDWQLRITFASDATDLLLTQWAEDCDIWLRGRNRRAWLLVAGDDTLMFCFNKVRFVLEGDFSMYDQSESAGPLDMELTLAAKQGMSVEAGQLLATSYRAKYKLNGKFHRWIVHHSHRPMRATGGPDTTYGNSIVGGCAWAILVNGGVLEKYAQEDFSRLVELGMKSLGFKLKLKVVHDLESSSFLKGSWVVVGGRLHWGPLPSRILKLGKALVDPRTIYPDLDYAQACSQFLNDVAASYRNFVQMPCVGAFVRRYYKGPARRDLFVSAPWKVASAFSASPGIPSSVPGLASRYQVPEDWLWDADSMVESSQEFTFLEHPLFRTLGRVDYG